MRFVASHCQAACRPSNAIARLEPARLDWNIRYAHARMRRVLVLKQIKSGDEVGGVAARGAGPTLVVSSLFLRWSRDETRRD